MERFLYQYRKDKIRLRIALVFPNSYSIGMANLGFQWVYHQLQLNPQISCERAFFDPEQTRIKTMESGRELTQFDIVLFSISFEADLPNILKILNSARIPVSIQDREGPFIAVGGIGTTILPLYLKEFADVIFSGDAEAVLNPFIEAVLKNGISEKNKIINAIQTQSGIYLPENIQNKTLPYYRCSGSEPVHSVILSDESEFPNRGLIEASRSCLFRCAFCLVSNAYGPYEHLPAEKIIQTAEIYQGITNKLGLVAATLSNHPDFKEILITLNKMDFQLSFSAFRIEDLDDELLEKIISNENKTLVIAPETASARLKKAIRKPIPNELIFETVRKACKMGIKRLKLYFLVGLPDETEEDLKEMVEFIREIRKISQEYASEFGYIPEMIIDINPLVPKPLTAFEGLPFEDIKSLKSKIVYLKSNIRNFGRVFVYGESPKNALLQYKLANHQLSWEEVLKL